MAQKGLKKAIDNTPAKKKETAWEKERERDAKIVNGKFIWRECPGGTLEFHYRKYANDPVRKYRLTDGYEYDLPIGVVKHLINECQVEEATNKVKLVDPNTYKPLYEVKKNPRFAFITSEYIS